MTYMVNTYGLAMIREAIPCLHGAMTHGHYWHLRSAKALQKASGTRFMRCRDTTNCVQQQVDMSVLGRRLGSVVQLSVKDVPLFSEGLKFGFSLEVCDRKISIQLIVRSSLCRCIKVGAIFTVSLFTSQIRLENDDQSNWQVEVVVETASVHLSLYIFIYTQT